MDESRPPRPTSGASAFSKSTLAPAFEIGTSVTTLKSGKTTARIEIEVKRERPIKRERARTHESMLFPRPHRPRPS